MVILQSIIAYIRKSYKWLKIYNSFIALYSVIYPVINVHETYKADI